MSYLIVNTLMLLLAASGCLIVGALILNDLPLHDEPGLLVRLRTYLTSNVAQTRRNALFPELELRSYRLTPPVLFGRVENAVDMLGWKLVEADPTELRLHAVVQTRLFKFRDDVEIQLRLGDAGTELHVRSMSRVGRGDFGANTRHIMDLHNALARFL